MHRGDNTQDNLKRILREPVSNMVHRALSETNTRFMIDQFFVKSTLDAMTANFGMDMYMKVGSVDGLVDFLVDGFVDSQEFNMIVKQMFQSTLGQNFPFNGNDLFDVLFMSKAQANSFLLSPKYNLMIPLIHLETLGLVSNEKVEVNLWGFDAKIIGHVEYEKDISVYMQAVNEDKVVDVDHVDKEPTFLDKEEAEERADHIGAEGVHETESGYRADSSPEDLEGLYEGRHEPENKILSNVTDNLDNDKIYVEKEFRIMEEKEDYKEVANTFKVEKDWSMDG